MSQKLIYSLITFGVLAFISGCSQLTKNQDQQPNPSTSSASTSSKGSTASYKPSNMTADMMYKVLVAEILLKKRKYKDAFNILYPMTVEIRDPSLAKRVFKLSMHTLDVNAIEAATSLWLEISPEKEGPWKAAYLLAVREGEIKNAKKKWQKYADLTKKNIEEVFVETSLRISKSAPKVAGLSFLNSLQTSYPKNPAAIFAFGSAAEEYQEYNLAIPKLKEAIYLYENINEENLTEISLEIKKEAYYSLANSYLRVKKFKQGIKEIEPQANRNLKDWRLQESLARLQVRAGLLKQAEDRYNLAIEAEAKASSSRLSLALLQLEQSNYTKADRNFLILRKNRTYHSIATYYLGVSAQQQKKNKKAVKYYSQVKTRDYYIDAQIRILELKYSSDGLNKTIKKINKIETKTNKDKVKLYRASAVFYKHANKLQRAVNAYQSAKTLEPNNVDLLLSQAYIYYELEDFKRYEENLLIALKIEPSNVDALNALGYYYVEQSKKLEQAGILLQTANRLDPNSYYIIDSLGWLAYKKNEFNKSEKLLEKAFGLEKDLEVLLHLMQVKIQLDRKEEAIELGKKYQPQFKNSRTLKKLLKSIKR